MALRSDFLNFNSNLTRHLSCNLAGYLNVLDHFDWHCNLAGYLNVLDHFDRHCHLASDFNGYDLIGRGTSIACHDCHETCQHCTAGQLQVHSESAFLLHCCFLCGISSSAVNHGWATVIRIARAVVARVIRVHPATSGMRTGIQRTLVDLAQSWIESVAQPIA